MTAAPPVDRAAASRLVAALDTPGPPSAAITPRSPRSSSWSPPAATPRSRRLNLGHFAAGRWQLTDQATNRPEVLVSGEGVHRGRVDVLGTLLHKAGRHSNPALLVQLPRRGTAPLRQRP